MASLSRTSILLHLLQANQCFEAVLQKWGSAVIGLMIRCFVAWQFLKSASLKVTNWNGTLDLFREEYQVPLLDPVLAAYLGTGAELFFPLLLILGWFSRAAALGLFAVNGVAVLSYPLLWELACSAALDSHFYWGVMLLSVVGFGGGKWSVDHLLRHRIHP